MRKEGKNIHVHKLFNIKSSPRVLQTACDSAIILYASVRATEVVSECDLLVKNNI